MIQVADNFNYRGKKPNFDRDSFDTLYDPENSVLNFIGGAIGNGTIIGNKTKVINLNVDRIILSGTWFDSGITSNRPTNVLVGFQYFDTTVNKPIFGMALNGQMLQELLYNNKIIKIWHSTQLKMN